MSDAPRDWVCAACQRIFTDYGDLERHYRETIDDDHWPPYKPPASRGSMEEAVVEAARGLREARRANGGCVECGFMLNHSIHCTVGEILLALDILDAERAARTSRPGGGA